MSGHMPFDTLRASIDANPERRARVERGKRFMREVSALTKLREARGVTQEEIARAWDASQANISRVEHEDDIYLSTLTRYVEALGGYVEIAAVFPDQTIRLADLAAPESDQHIA